MFGFTPRKTFIRLKTSTPASQPGQSYPGEPSYPRYSFGFDCNSSPEDHSEDPQARMDQLENQASNGEDGEQQVTQEETSPLLLYSDSARVRQDSPQQHGHFPFYTSTPEADVRVSSAATSPTVIHSTEFNFLTSDEDSDMSGTTDEDENSPSIQNWLPSANDDDKCAMLVKMSNDMKKLRARNRQLRAQKRLQSSAKRSSRGSAVATPALGASTATVADAALAEMVSLVGEQSVRIKTLESRVMAVLDENKMKDERIEDLVYDLGRAQDSARASSAALGHSQGQHHEALDQLRRKEEELQAMAQQLQQAQDSFEKEVRESQTRRDSDARTIESLRRECQELEARPARETDGGNRLTEPCALLNTMDQSSRCEKVIESVWKPLQAQVAVLARDTLRGPIPATGMLPEFYEGLSAIWPQWEKHTDNPSIRAGLVEAYLWSQIEKYCGLGPNGVWGGPMGNAFRSVSRSLVKDFLGEDIDPEKAAAYCWWRSSGAYMLSQTRNNDDITGVEQPWIDTVDRQVRVLKPLLVRSPQPDENLQAFQELRGRLEKMFYKVRLLDDAFMSSRQLWSLDFSRHADLFDPDAMVRGFKVKDKDGAEAAAAANPSLGELRVRFVISPALYVLGADGRYNTWILFRKARVDCYAEGDGPAQQPRQMEVSQNDGD
ncbi:hypothetical protein ACRALDRAFT_1069219 [Sodiomyces alcalophilus JCM 7366]|uniref:uncharacterized protein n=1 Tax=Sodiomyces alcalophilus JCM 7366 TaxID=591952 RepID=UPI0039B4DE0E